MFLNFTVPIPRLKGKISRQGTKSGTYIHYVLERSYDPKKKHTVPKRVLIGKCVGETETMVPNENFLVFFPDAVLPEVRESARRCSTLMAGSYIVIANIVQTYGLGKMLQKHFLDRAGLVLDLAAYMIIEERNQGQYYPDYAYRHPLFSKDMRIASDAAISNFLANVSPDQISGFLNDWNAKRDHRSRIYISYDSTNKNCQAGDVDFVEFGKAKVDQGCPIFNLAVAYDKTNQVPLFYECYPGSINDVSQFKFLVDKAIAYNYKRIGFIIDRGYFCKINIDYMDANNFEFIMMVKGCKALVAELVDRLHGTFENRVDASLREHCISGTTEKMKLFPEDSRERYFHVFFNPMKMATERRDIENALTQMQKNFDQWVGREVEFGSPHTDYFQCHYDEKGRFLFAEEKKSIIEHAYSRCGYFCIITSEKMSARDAYLQYRGRDASEKLFSADKSFLGSKSMRVHSAEAVRAKIFIEFIALIIRQRLYNLLKDEMLRLPTKRNYMTVPAAIRELEKIELVRIKDGRYQLDHAITRTQEIILKSFGMTKDKVMSQAAAISAALAGKKDSMEDVEDLEPIGEEENEDAEA